MPGPSWQQRDVGFEREEDDPEERLRELGRRQEKRGKRALVWLWIGVGAFLVGGIADALSDDDLTFDAVGGEEEGAGAVGQSSLRYRASVQY